jgi:hypothetical protein
MSPVRGAVQGVCEEGTEAQLSKRSMGRQLCGTTSASLSFSMPIAQIRLATFEFAGSGAPLSWQMNSAQIQAIPESWHDRVYGPNNADWWEVDCFFHPGGKDCVNGKAKKGAW